MLAVFLPHSIPPRLAVEHARSAEAAGFDAVMLADSLLRDVTATMAAIATKTERLRVGSAVAPIYTRNVAALAAVAATLDSLAPGRISLGLGAWWEPIATKVGIDRGSSLAVMRDVVESLRGLLAGDEVTRHGSHVHLDAVVLDDIGSGRAPADVPILVGATGPKMLELAGEVADGVIMNYLVSPSATAEAAATVARGRLRADARRPPFERWQLIACSVDDDRRRALDAARPLVTRALAFQSHIVAASGVDPDLIATISSRLSFPASDAAVADVATLVPDRVVTDLTASGTPDECRAALDSYRVAGCDHPILFPMDDDVLRLIRMMGDRRD